jgi:hypothetical protein
LTLRRTLLLVALAGFACALPAARAAAASLPSIGVTDWLVPSARQFETLGASGIRTYRAQLNWSAVEAQPGDRDWQGFDTIVARAAAGRLRVLPVLLGSPAWAAARPQNPPSPAARAAFLQFARDAAARYGRRGTFWTSHPELVPVAPTHWQIWNEPNLPVYWNDRPNAREYVSLLKDTRAAVLAGDPTAKIALAGLPESRLGIRGDIYLRQIYAVRGAKRLFDVVAVHPYAVRPAGVLAVVDRARRSMVKAGDARKPIWLTEIGWSTGGLPSPYTTSEGGQASYIRQLLASIKRVRVRQRIGLLVWFSISDRLPYAGEKDWWAIHTGLFRLDGAPKPAWQVLSGYARGRSASS